MKQNIIVILVLSVINLWGQQSITTIGTPVIQDFSIGTDPNTSLPIGFKMTTNWTTGITSTTQAAGTLGSGILNGSSPGGFYNFANGVSPTSTERAIGFLSSNGYTSPRSIIYAFTNNTGSSIISLTLSWNYEKYRSGSRIFDWSFFHGDTPLATVPEQNGNQNYSADTNNTTVFNPPQSITKSFSINNIMIPNGTTYYLRWTYTGLDGSTNAQALAIDDFSITLNNTLSSQDFNLDSQISVLNQGEKIVVKLTENLIKQIEVMNITGKKIFVNNSINSNLYEIIGLEKSNNVLFISVEDVFGIKQTKKIIY